MQIGCTKTLLDFLNVTPAPVDSSADPFFCWYAGIKAVNRKNMIVVSNEASRFSFVLYGFTPSKTKHANQIFQEGIRKILLHARINPNLIERYLADCETKIIFTKNRSAKTVSRMNRTILDTENNLHLLNAEKLFQTALSSKMNTLPTTIEKKNGDSFPYLELYRCFREHYPTEPVCKATFLTLEISLDGTDCIRVLRLPAELTVSELHKAIQVSFNWRDRNSHAFFSEKIEPLNRLFPYLEAYVDYNRFDDSQEEMEKRLTIEELFRMRDTMIYAYDFAIGWTHVIRFLRREILTEISPNICILATGDAPPENIGSVEIFHQFLKAIGDPNHPQHEPYSDFARANLWQPLDAKKMNHYLHHLLSM